MTDAGLLLAHGEGVLLRQHKAGSAETVLRMAVKAAAERRDLETLKRLAIAAKQLDKPQLAQTIAAVQKLAAESRSTIRESVDLSDMDPQQALLLEALFQHIERLRIRGRRSELISIARKVASEDRFPVQLRQAIQQLAESVEQSNSEPTELLDKLSGSSRIGYSWWFENRAGRTMFMNTVILPNVFSATGPFEIPPGARPRIDVLTGIVVTLSKSRNGRYRGMIGRYWHKGFIQESLYPPAGSYEIRRNSYRDSKIYQPGT